MDDIFNFYHCEENCDRGNYKDGRTCYGFEYGVCRMNWRILRIDEDCLVKYIGQVLLFNEENQ